MKIRVIKWLSGGSTYFGKGLTLKDYKHLIKNHIKLFKSVDGVTDYIDTKYDR